MGTYIYTFRKASRNIIVDGKKSFVQHLSYAYKPSYAWDTSARYKRFVATMERHAEESFAQYDGGYIVIDDVKTDGKLTDLDGLNVFKGLTCCRWVDCYDHGMELVGKLKKIGRSYHLIRTPDKKEE